MEETHSPGEPEAGSQTDSESETPSRQKKKRSRPLELFETIFIALLLAILIRATLAEARFIPSGSMIPTLLIGDRLIVEKLSYYLHGPERGDIVVFYPPDPAAKPLDGTGKLLRWLGFTRDAAFIKRVVGMPGETLAVRNGKVLINGKPLDEPYIKTPPLDDFPLDKDDPPLKIPPNNYFMMGDNRNNSRDSRFWGTMPRENVIGRTVLRFWPVNRMGSP